MQDTQAQKQTPAFSFTLRPAEAHDAVGVATLMRLGGMSLAPDWQNAVVAVDADDAVVGYLRVQQTAKGPHVAPVAVDPGWQGSGLGRALMEDAVKRHGYLKLVSRGEVAGFYRSLGCHEIPFSEISGDLEEDCEHCPDRELCQPVAFIMEGETVHA